ncbi:Hypothetical predicted protein [Marmota monax]|uniref:Uncharacterized protein n=1 Tax=Marmota monax TaxID=9995 RepID=A0A5E4AUQ7_MARMO|nr:hypothetical protein GHT09_017002 [Marmota monax]VTJ60272.1 Hypothetical predicted protein [Marmota monax]
MMMDWKAVAAQKLNLSSKKKKHRPSTSSVAETPLFATSFSGILQTSPPPAPPCLLRAVNKVKDTPGLGKVDVDFHLVLGCTSLCPTHAQYGAVPSLKSRPQEMQVALQEGPQKLWKNPKNP